VCSAMGLIWTRTGSQSGHTIPAQTGSSRLKSLLAELVAKLGHRYEGSYLEAVTRPLGQRRSSQARPDLNVYGSQPDRAGATAVSQPPRTRRIREETRGHDAAARQLQEDSGSDPTPGSGPA
jgi:hypothetical protein